MNQDRGEGVRQRFVVADDYEGVPLLRFLSQNLGISASAAKRALDAHNVFVNKRRVWIGKHPLRHGDVVECILIDESRQPATPELRYRDSQCVVIDKPAGLLSQSEPKTRASAEVWLRAQEGCSGARAVHRLDRETSGCLLFALNRQASDELIEAFKRRSVDKQYLAIVEGRMPYSIGTFADPLDGKHSLTHFEVLACNDQASFLRIRLETGRMHQIRRHFAAKGFPLLGEREYRRGGVSRAVYREILRQMLHAEQIRFRPSWCNEQDIIVSAPIPEDFSTALRLLKLPLL